MACCLTASSHYLNQCCLIIRKVQWYSSEDDSTSNISAINHSNNLEHYLYKIPLKSPRGQWVKVWWHILQQQVCTGWFVRTRYTTFPNLGNNFCKLSCPSSHYNEPHIDQMSCKSTHMCIFDLNKSMVVQMGHHPSLKRKWMHSDNIVCTGCTGSCNFNNFQCIQWQKFHPKDDTLASLCKTWGFCIFWKPILSMKSTHTDTETISSTFCRWYFQLYFPK